MHLEVSHVTVGFDSQPVLDNLAFALAAGEIGCLLGASGCGKTTALRAIAGFEPVQGGCIHIGGQQVAGPHSHLPPEQRRVGMVFQDYALFPHLSAADNVAFGLRNLGRRERRDRVHAMLELVGLAQAANQFPHQLSGGQQQRIAVARALAPDPTLLLMDEPFSNLDVELRERLSLEVRDILKTAGTTALIVTHDQHEAFALADKVGLMRGGSIEQWDTAYNLYHRPASRYVAKFIGQGVLVPGRVTAPDCIQLPLGCLPPRNPLPVGTAVDVLIRPDDIIHDESSPHRGRILARNFRGASILYTLSLDDGTRLLSLLPSHVNHQTGESLGIRLVAEHVIAFPLSAS